MVNDILTDARHAMQKAVEALQHEMASVRTGRASTHLLDQIRVEYYGSQMPIVPVASHNSTSFRFTRRLAPTRSDKSRRPRLHAQPVDPVGPGLAE